MESPLIGPEWAVGAPVPCFWLAQVGPCGAPCNLGHPASRDDSENHVSFSAPFPIIFVLVVASPPCQIINVHSWWPCRLSISLICLLWSSSFVFLIVVLHVGNLFRELFLNVCFYLLVFHAALKFGVSG